MLGEEYQMICGSSANLATPATPTITARTAGSNETTVGANGTYDVKVTATNWFGETAASAAATGSSLAGQVIDVTIVPSLGAMNYNIYVSTNGTNYYLAVTGVGGTKYTLQGTPPSGGTAAPTTDSGTGKSTRIEGIIPTLTGVSANAGVYPTSPVMWQGGYINQAVGTHLSYSAIYTALENLWQQATNSPGAFKADPAELISSGIDIANLSTDVISQGQGTNYELFISQQQVGDVTVGAAVSQFQNPLTKSLLKLVVHPWYTQGNCELLSYQLPQTWTNVANAWEMTMVQDYVENLAPRCGDVPMGSALPGEPHQIKGNPGRSRCPGARRERMSGLCAMDATAGHCAGTAAEQETFRACGMANRRKRAEMTCSLTSLQVVSGNRMQYRLAGYRCHLSL